MASPMSWDFIPLFHILASLSRASFEPSDRQLLSQHRHQQANRVAPVQPLLGSVRIGELGLCIGRLFRHVIVLWMACSSSSLSEKGFVHLCPSQKCRCSDLSVPWSIPRAAVVIAFSALSVCSKRSKRFRDTLASSWSLSPSLLSLFNLSQIFSPPAFLFRSHATLLEHYRGFVKDLGFPQISHRGASSSAAIQ